MGATLDMLKSMFPGKAMLSVDDVAQVLGRTADRAGRQAVRAGLHRGDLLPGLRKVLGRWLVPITTLADWLDSLREPVDASGLEVGPTRRSVVNKAAPPQDRPRRGRVPDKVREAERRARAGQFFAEVETVLLRDDLAAALPPATPGLPPRKI